ncbi:histidine phosphatase family protein, partial [Xenorhabdus bovienii]|uniref:histidine phosphatase family protein n=1 Tax=Xenorhabdus bovienii TaxID=40576 RepID=UPI0023B248B4
ELHMGVLENRELNSLTSEEESWRKSLVDGTPNGRIPEGESMSELAIRMRAALENCLNLPTGSRPLLVSHGMALVSLLCSVLGLPANS